MVTPDSCLMSWPIDMLLARHGVFQGEKSEGEKYGVKIPRVKILGENSQGVKYGVKIPRV